MYLLTDEWCTMICCQFFSVLFNKIIPQLEEWVPFATCQLIFIDCACHYCLTIFIVAIMIFITIQIKVNHYLAVALSQIVDVIPGRKSATFQLYHGTQDEELCFTVVYTEGGEQRTLDLISSSAEEASLWTNGLLALTGNGMRLDLIILY